MTAKKVLITVKEASELTNLSITTLRRGVKTGRFPALRSGGEKSKHSKILFDERMLLKALQGEVLNNVKNEQHRCFLETLSQDEEDCHPLRRK